MVGIAGIGRNCDFDIDIYDQFLADIVALPDCWRMFFYWQFDGQGRMGTGKILPGSHIAQTLSVIIQGGKPAYEQKNCA